MLKLMFPIEHVIPITVIIKLQRRQFKMEAKTTPCLGKSSYPFHSILNYSKPFNFLNPTNHSIPFHFFSTFFFNFPNPYTISLNFNNLYHLEIHKVKPFNIIFFQTIPNHFRTILTIPINGME